MAETIVIRGRLTSNFHFIGDLNCPCDDSRTGAPARKNKDDGANSRIL